MTDLLAGIDTARRARKLQQTESERLWMLENLPAELKADLKAAAISQTEILAHWEPFLACLRCYARQLVEISALMPFPIEPRPHSRHLSVDPATELRKILRSVPCFGFLNLLSSVLNQGGDSAGFSSTKGLTSKLV